MGVITKFHAHIARVHIYSILAPILVEPYIHQAATVYRLNISCYEIEGERRTQRLSQGTVL